MRTKLYSSLTGLALALASLTSSAAIAETNEPEWRYADSLISTPQMPKGFKHFPYVNPDAPKGGRVRLSTTGTYDSLNLVASKGVRAGGLGLIYDTLMTPSMSESSTEYGLIADAMKYPDDYAWVVYRLRLMHAGMTESQSLQRMWAGHLINGPHRILPANTIIVM